MHRLRRIGCHFPHPVSKRTENELASKTDLCFQDEVVIVTGGTTGIGQACVEYFHEKRALVWNLDVSTPKSSQPGVRFIQTDVGDVSQLRASISSILRQTNGRVDHLICCAGVHLFQDIENTSVEDFNRVVNINYRGTFFAIQAVIPAMKKASGGSIVVIGSDQSFIGKAFSAVYGSTKGAIAQLTKSTAVQYAKEGIRVNCVCPGTIETPLYHNAVKQFCKLTGTKEADAYEGLKTAQPIPRIGTPSEVAFVVGWVSKSGFMTGAQVSIDGGYVAT